MPVAAVALANQGETVLAWDRATGEPLSPAIVWQDRRAESICAELAADPRTGSPHAPGWCSTRTSPRRRWPGCAANVTTAGVVTTTDTWLVHQLTRRVRHRRRHREPVAAARSRHGDAGTPSCSSCSGSPARRCPRSSACDEVVGDDDRVRPPDPGRRADRRPAGGPARPGLPGPGDGEMHLRHRRVPARATPAAGRALRSGRADRLGRLAGCAARRTYCLDGQVYTAASAVRWLQRPRPDRVGRRPRRASPRPTPAACCACPRWPGWPRRGGGRTPPRRSPA